MLRPALQVFLLSSFNVFIFTFYVLKNFQRYTSMINSTYDISSAINSRLATVVHSVAATCINRARLTARQKCTEASFRCNYGSCLVETVESRRVILRRRISTTSPTTLVVRKVDCCCWSVLAGVSGHRLVRLHFLWSLPRPVDAIDIPAPLYLAPAEYPAKVANTSVIDHF